MGRELPVACVYVLALAAGLAIFNENAEHQGEALAVWLVASAAFGFAIARPWAFLFPVLIGVPLALPFGYAEDHLGSDAPLVWFFAALASLLAMVVVLAATAARLRWDRRGATG